MTALSAKQLLLLWDQGASQLPFQQAAHLLAAACPELSTEALMNLTIGQRDERLLGLRELLFGSSMAGMASCPACKGRSEFTMNTADIRTLYERSAGEQLSCAMGEYTVEFRLPRTKDLQAIANETDPGRARVRILEECITGAYKSEEPTITASLPDDILEAVANRMGEADREADVMLALSCPQCGRHWQEAFDIATFLWSEISAWAYHTLRDVHTLASRYGWSEADILEMSASRRQHYLTLIGA